MKLPGAGKAGSLIKNLQTGALIRHRFGGLHKVWEILDPPGFPG